MTTERIYRWELGLIATALLGATGVVFRLPAVILAASIPLAYFTVAAVNRLPDTAGVVVERELSRSVPRPGERVDVTLTVRNEGSVVLTDVRVVDAVPDELAVIDGSPRGVFSLRPGTEAEVAYTVVAVQGTHSFDEPYVRLRTMSGGRRRTMRVRADGSSSFACAVHPLLPLDVGDTVRTGDATTGTAGEGLEFHTLREYRSGDAITRIDWRRYAKTGDLVTVEFDERRTATVMIVLDLRDETRFTPHAGHPDGIELSAYAGYALFEEFVTSGHRTGLTGVGIDTQRLGSDVRCLGRDWAWIEPGTGSETRARADRLYATIQDHLLDPDESASGSTASSGGPAAAADGGDLPTKRFVQRLPSRTPVVVVSTVMDDYFVEFTRRLRTGGHDVTVVSPDVTDGEGTGATIEAVERSIRLNRIRNTGAAAVDWDPSEPLQVAIESSGVTFN